MDSLFEFMFFFRDNLLNVVVKRSGTVLILLTQAVLVIDLELYHLLLDVSTNNFQLGGLGSANTVDTHLFLCS